MGIAIWHMFVISLERIFRIFSCVALPVSLYWVVFSKSPKKPKQEQGQQTNLISLW
jgi:hypothetical protein